jgi:nitroreductase
MNETLKVIARRQSVRSFKDEPLTEDEKSAILQAAFRAPTAGNMMLYSILEIDDQALKDRLAVICDHQPFIARTPFLLLFVADYQRWVDYFNHSQAPQRALDLGRPPREPAEGDFMIAFCDALIAAQNAVIAAESLGIGSCYIGDILENFEEQRQMFDLPRYAVPAALLCFGRPGADLPEQAPRFDPKYVAFRNKYQRFSGPDLEEMMESTRQRYHASGKFFEGAQNVGQSVYLRKFIADYSLEMTRSVRKLLAVWTGREE